MTISSAELNSWIGAFLWPLFRIGALFMVAPITGSSSVPVRARMILALAVTVALVPSLPLHPPVEWFTLEWFTMIFQQTMIGIVMGFALQLVFATVIFGGLIIAMQMGLGFAQMVDQLNGAQVPVVSQLYLVMVTLLFLGMDGHLLMVKLLAESFTVLPVGVDGISRDGYRVLAEWGSQLFALGLWIALPALASMLVLNISLGVMARAAPQLNIFSVGFPITMIMGYFIILYTLPGTATQFETILQSGVTLMQQLIGAR